MSRSLKSTLVARDCLKTETLRLKMPERSGRAFDCWPRRKSFHKSLITNDLAWTLTSATPQNSLCARRGCVAADRRSERL